MEYIRIRNWDKFQHYKKRNPAWVKTYSSVLDDYDFACLPDASKTLFLLFPLLAARANNKIPHDPEWIQGRLHLKTTPDLSHLFSINFIELIPASNVLAGCKQVATPETETEQRRGETDRDIQTETRKRFLIDKAKEIAGGKRF